MEVHLNASIAPVNLSNNNDNNNKLIPPSTDSPDPPISTSKDSSINIRVNANNIIIHTNLDESISTREDEASQFTVHTKVLYKGTKVTIIQVI